VREQVRIHEGSLPSWVRWWLLALRASSGGIFSTTCARRVIYLSSYLYGTPTSLPIPETAEVRASNPYALSKRMGEEACQFVADTAGVRVVILRPFNVYGPGQRDGFLIPRILRQVQAGAAIRVNDLEPRRDFVHVPDLTRAILRTMEFPGDFAVFNIGSGASHSVADLIHLVQSEWRTNLPVISEGVRRPGEIMDTVADISMARRQLGWRPEISLQQGLAQMHRDLVSESARG
jgi:nucleoside-diphosphate-sugar epimerase